MARRCCPYWSLSPAKRCQAKPNKGASVLHAIENVSQCLKFIKSKVCLCVVLCCVPSNRFLLQNVYLESIHPEDIVTATNVSYWGLSGRSFFAFSLARTWTLPSSTSRPSRTSYWCGASPRPANRPSPDVITQSTKCNFFFLLCILNSTFVLFFCIVYLYFNKVVV